MAWSRLTEALEKIEDIKVNLENSLYYVTHHSESIIQWLFLMILILGAVVAARGLFRRASAEAPASTAGAVPSAELQSFMQKVLEQTAKLESVAVGNLSPGDAAQLDVHVQALKKDLATRDEELAKLRAGGEIKTSGDAHLLGGRIKELEAKLAEYEILEDDIADLSLYKEENARLRADLEKAKSAAPPATPDAPSGEDIVAEFAEAVSGDAVPPVEAQELSNLEKKLAEPPAPPPPTSPDPTPVAAAPARAPTEEGDDLFAEFAADPVDAPEPGALDTDKMMEEMAALVSGDLNAGGPRTLEEGIDTEKMAAEATSLTKA